MDLSHKQFCVKRNFNYYLKALESKRLKITLKGSTLLTIISTCIIGKLVSYCQ